MFGTNARIPMLYSVPDGHLIAAGKSLQNSFEPSYDATADLVYGIKRVDGIDDAHDSTEVLLVELDSLSIVRRFRVFYQYCGYQL